MKLAERIHDPGRVILGRGLRVGVVTPLAFGVAEIADADPQTSVFVAFGTFALLAFSDFGGPPRRRLAAYGAATIAGALLIVIGTPFAREPLLAGALALPIAFLIRFTGGFSGQLSAAITPLTLAFVLAVALEAPPSAIGDRLIGWLAAGAVSGAAALLLWPHYGRARLIQRTGAAVASFADAIGGTAPAPAQGLLEQLRDESEEGPLTHSGTIAEEHALRRIITGLVRLNATLPLAPAELEEGRALQAKLQRALQAAGSLLGGGSEEPDEAALDAARVAHLRALGSQARERLDRGAEPSEVVASIDAAFTLRLASFVGLAIAANSLLLLGRDPLPDDRLAISLGGEAAPAAPSPVGQAALLARRRLHLGSARLQDSARAAIGIAAAVIIAGVADVSHGFWVVLATLMVLRSNALGTGRTAIEAVGGTTVGFLIGSALMLLIGAGEVGLWIALPLGAFLAAYAGPAINFIAGQAAFALFVIVLFNLVQPVGWEVGLIRLETVAIGAGVSLLAGVLLWPRGALPLIGATAAEAYRTAARYLDAALRGGRDAATDERRDLAYDSLLLTADALAQHRTEPGVHLSASQRMALLDGPRIVNAVADGIRVVDQLFPGTMPASPALDRAGQALVARLETVAGEIGDRGARPSVDPAPAADLDGAPRAEVVAGVRDWVRGSEPEPAAGGAGPLQLVWRRDWLKFTAEELAVVEGYAHEAAPTLSLPWYRR